MPRTRVRDARGVSTLHVWLVCPAWGRFPVTRLALAQRAHLAGELAPRGIDLRCVVIADDANLALAREYGFDTLELPNRPVARKLNAGFEYAYRAGAEWAAFIGSDDWLHPELFEPLTSKSAPSNAKGLEIVSGHQCAVVNLLTGRLRYLGWRHKHGIPPWFIPRPLLARAGVNEQLNRGLDGSLARSLPGDARWLIHDPHDLARVDFKSSVNITAYDTVAPALGVGPEVEPWPALAERYPAELVALAEQTHHLLRQEVAA